jgi:hypothetical protein
MIDPQPQFYLAILTFRYTALNPAPRFSVMPSEPKSRAAKTDVAGQTHPQQNGFKWARNLHVIFFSPFPIRFSSWMQTDVPGPKSKGSASR